MSVATSTTASESFVNIFVKPSMSILKMLLVVIVLCVASSRLLLLIAMVYCRCRIDVLVLARNVGQKCVYKKNNRTEADS
jgi:hypothetical protein